MYFLAINRIVAGARPDTLVPVIREHAAWVAEGVATGRIIQAGKWGTAGGMVIVRAEGEEQARALLAADPLLRSGLVDLELAQFWPDVAGNGW